MWQGLLYASPPAFDGSNLYLTGKQAGNGAMAEAKQHNRSPHAAMGQLLPPGCGRNKSFCNWLKTLHNPQASTDTAGSAQAQG